MKRAKAQQNEARETRVPVRKVRIFTEPRISLCSTVPFEATSKLSFSMTSKNTSFCKEHHQWH
jgi:hypothetical protein